jgi:hypothetical protein
MVATGEGKVIINCHFYVVEVLYIPKYKMTPLNIFNFQKKYIDMNVRNGQVGTSLRVCILELN